LEKEEKIPEQVAAAVLDDNTRLKELLKADPELFKQKYNGLSALHGAVHVGNLKNVKLLVESGVVDVNETDQYGNTPLLTAIYLGYMDIVRYLLSERKVDKTIRNKENIGFSGMFLRSPALMGDKEKQVEYIRFAVNEMEKIFTGENLQRERQDLASYIREDSFIPDLGKFGFPYYKKLPQEVQGKIL